MKFPLSWLQEYIDCFSPPAQIARLLTMAGIEVEGFEPSNSFEESGGLQKTADTIFNVAITPNLGHCASIIGLARELAAAMRGKVRYTPVVIPDSDICANLSLCVSVEDSTLCPRYACRRISGVTVGTSPRWLTQRLESSGFRSVNNVVDITNYVLLEMGQPLHPFDFEKIAQQTLVVRSARPGESLCTLDGKECLLESGDILICDKEKPLALAGIMGGRSSEVTSATVDILLESAWFNSKAIRRTSKRLGINSEASRRFERGCDPNAIIAALDRAALLIQQLCGGEINQGVIDIYPVPAQPRTICCSIECINQLLGLRLSLGDIENIFARLECTTASLSVDELAVTVPSYRNDLQSQIDLIEEVARLYGYDRFDKAAAPYRGSTLPHVPLFSLERNVREHLLKEGLQEFITCDLINPTVVEIINDPAQAAGELITILNPSSIEQSILRPTLLPGLLQLIKYNIDHQNCDVSGFEIGKIHFRQQEHYFERTAVSIALTGRRSPLCWDQEDQSMDFFDLKGMVESLFRALGVHGLHVVANNLSVLHPGRQAALFVASQELGSIGEVHPTLLRRLGINQRVFFAEINLSELLHQVKHSIKMTPLQQYPASERDWTVTVPEEFPLERLIKALRATASPLVENIFLLKLYRSDKVGVGKKNVSLRFIYRDSEKTIEQASVDAEHLKLTTYAMTQLGV